MDLQQSLLHSMPTRQSMISMARATVAERARNVGLVSSCKNCSPSIFSRSTAREMKPLLPLGFKARSLFLLPVSLWQAGMSQNCHRTTGSRV